MVNSSMLKLLIKNKGIKMEVLARNLGISTTSLKSKIEGRTDFKSEEMYALKNALGLSAHDIYMLFFRQNSECDSHMELGTRGNPLIFQG